MLYCIWRLILASPDTLTIGTFMAFSHWIISCLKLQFISCVHFSFHQAFLSTQRDPNKLPTPSTSCVVPWTCGQRRALQRYQFHILYSYIRVYYEHLYSIVNIYVHCTVYCTSSINILYVLVCIHTCTRTNIYDYWLSIYFKLIFIFNVTRLRLCTNTYASTVTKSCDLSYSICTHVTSRPNFTWQIPSLGLYLKRHLEYS